MPGTPLPPPLTDAGAPAPLPRNATDPALHGTKNTGDLTGQPSQRWRRRLRTAPRLVRAGSAAVLALNALLVVSGGAVRLTNSGLGCPSWPRCSDASYHNTPAYGVHGYIEFGNRVFGFLLGVIVALTITLTLLQRPRRASLVWLSVAQFFGFIGQAVLGGITVLTGLNPWTVAGHFLFSMLLIYAAFALWRRAGEGDEPRRFALPPALIWLVRATTAAALLVICVGTIVTGSGPHSGDRSAPRTGFDPQAVSQLHTDAVFLLIGLTIAGWLTFRAVNADPAVLRATRGLFLVEMAQAVIGFTQYFTKLPVALVALHLAGACSVWLATLWLLFATRRRPHSPHAVGSETSSEMAPTNLSNASSSA